MKREKNNFSEEIFHTEKEGGDPEQWMLSFIDLISLLTSFFVLLYSMSVVRSEDFKEVSKSFNHALDINKNPGGSVPKEEEGLTVPKITIPPGSSLDYLYSLLYDKLVLLKVSSKVRLVRYNDRIAIVLEGDDTFEPGGVQLTGSAAEILPLIGDMLNAVPNQVEIIAGPDENMNGNPLYSSGWELAVARALTVADMLKERGYFRPINSFGRTVLSESRLSEEKYKFARRIDIVIEDKAAKNIEY